MSAPTMSIREWVIQTISEMTSVEEAADRILALLGDGSLRAELEALLVEWRKRTTVVRTEGWSAVHADKVALALSRHPAEESRELPDEQRVIEAAMAASAKVCEFFRELGDWKPNGNHELDYCLQSYLEEIIKGNPAALAAAPAPQAPECCCEKHVGAGRRCLQCPVHGMPPASEAPKPRYRCTSCGRHLDAVEVSGNSHTRSEDDGHGNEIPVQCGPVEPEEERG